MTIINAALWTWGLVKVLLHLDFFSSNGAFYCTPVRTHLHTHQGAAVSTHAKCDGQHYFLLVTCPLLESNRQPSANHKAGTPLTTRSKPAFLRNVYDTQTRHDDRQTNEGCLTLLSFSFLFRLISSPQQSVKFPESEAASKFRLQSLISIKGLDDWTNNSSVPPPSFIYSTCPSAHPHPDRYICRYRLYLR